MREIRRYLLVIPVLMVAALVTRADDVVWKGDRVVREPVLIRRQTLRIEPGARIAFRDRGLIRIEDGGLVATQAVFAARSTLTNDFRIVVQNGRLAVSRCVFRGMKAERPHQAHFLFGFLYNQFGNDSKFCDNKFIDCDSVMMLNASHAEFSRNLVIRCVKPFATLNCEECRFEGNEFFNTEAGLNLSATRLSDVFRNRFTDCPIGMVLYSCGGNKTMGNAFFGGRVGMELWGLGPGGVFIGNRFEQVDVPFAKLGNAPHDPDNIFQNNEMGKR